MEFQTLKEFKSENYTEIIKRLIKENDGYVTSKLVT